MFNFGVSPDDVLDYTRSIRKALVIGLASFGEVERVTNRYDCLKLCKTELDKQLKPIHPTGTADTVGDFADAMMFVAIIETEALKAMEDEEANHG